MSNNMSVKRWNELSKGEAKLSQEEFKKGWHFCPEWDYALIGPGMKETQACSCFKSPQQCPTCED